MFMLPHGAHVHADYQVRCSPAEETVAWVYGNEDAGWCSGRRGQLWTKANKQSINTSSPQFAQTKTAAVPSSNPNILIPLSPHCRLTNDFL